MESIIANIDAIADITFVCSHGKSQVVFENIFDSQRDEILHSVYTKLTLQYRGGSIVLAINCPDVVSTSQEEV